MPDHARYDYLLKLPEDQDIARAIKKAMKAIEEYKPEFKGILPQDEYFRLTRTDTSIQPPAARRDGKSRLGTVDTLHAGCGGTDRSLHSG